MIRFKGWDGPASHFVTAQKDYLFLINWRQRIAIYFRDSGTCTYWF